MFVSAIRCAVRLGALAAFAAAVASASSLLWTRPTQQHCTAPAIFYVGDGGDAILTYGCRDSVVRGVNASTGAEIWTARLNSRVITDPVVMSATGSVFFGSRLGQVAALDVRTGKSLWTQNADNSITDAGPMALCDGVVVVGVYAGDVSAFDASTGNPLWTDSSSTAVSPNPVCSGGVAAFTLQYGGIKADNVTNQDTVWRTPTFQFGSAAFSRMTPVGNSLFAPYPDGTTYVLNFSTGAVTGRLALNTVLPIAAASGAIFATTVDGRVEARSQQQGHPFLWNSSAAGQFVSPPAPADTVPAQDVVYVGGAYGVWALSAATGATLDVVETNTAVARPPAAHRYRPGVVFFTTELTLYAVMMDGVNGRP